MNNFDFNRFYSKYNSIKKAENKQDGWFACIGITIYDNSNLNSSEIIELGLMQDGSKSVNGYECDELFDEVISYVEANSFWKYDTLNRIQNIVSAELFLDNESISIIYDEKSIELLTNMIENCIPVNDNQTNGICDKVELELANGETVTLLLASENDVFYLGSGSSFSYRDNHAVDNRNGLGKIFGIDNLVNKIENLNIHDATRFYKNIVVKEF